MSRLSSNNLKWIRNIIMASEMIVVFIMWLYIPPIIENNRLVHAGNGRYGSRLGFLLMVLFPLMGLLHGIMAKWDDREIHTDNAEERAMIEERWKIDSLKIQIQLSIFGFMTACFGVILAIFLG